MCYLFHTCVHFVLFFSAFLCFFFFPFSFLLKDDTINGRRLLSLHHAYSMTVVMKYARRTRRRVQTSGMNHPSKERNGPTMTSQNESIELLLQNRIYLYELMHAVFSGIPNEELIHLISQPVTAEAFSLLSENDGDLMSKMAHFTSIQDQKLAADPEYLDHLKSEYTKLLLGPGKMVAYPWESTYNGSENMLFQESTLRVRQAYRKYGYLPEEYPHVPDDHIALELHFLSKLSSLVLDAYKEGNRERALSVLKDQKVFMKYHIRNWFPKYAENIRRSATSYLYPQFGQVVDEFTRIDFDLIDELIEAIGSEV